MKPMKTASLKLFAWLALPLATFGQTAGLATSGETVATVAGQPVSEQELLEALGPQQWMQLRNQEYEAKSKALESLIRLKVVQAEARKRGITAESLIEQEVESKVAEPTDGEIESFFWGQGQTDAPFNAVKEQYRATLKRLKLQKARQAYADSLRAKIDVAVLLRAPSVEVAYDRARVKGDPQAPVTIVEFSDFQCPYCKKSESTLNGLLAKYGGRVKLAYMDFPLRDIHPQAQTAAEAARCAGEQGKFWEFHDALYADQAKLNRAELVTHAKTLSLDAAGFQSCLDSGKFRSKVEADAAQGSKLGVAGTPAFFVNGVFLSGAQPEAEFEKIIDRQLALVEGGRASQ
jgi:protein-disulfide isomerase